MIHGPYCELDGSCEECDCRGCAAPHSFPMCAPCQRWYV